jgi:hypothetical protein
MVRLIAFPLQRFGTFLLMNTGPVLLLLICNYFLSDNHVIAFVAFPKISGRTHNIKIETRDLWQQQQLQQQRTTTILTAFGRSSSSKSLSFLLRNNSKDSIAHNNDCIDSNPNCNPTISLPQTQTRPQQQQQQTQQQDLSDRRNVLFRMGTRALLATISVPSIVCLHPSSALALKQKNEALCGTGFFEHIYEYKCTSIGDIEDEGTSKELSSVETGVTDNLMGKLGFDTGDVIKIIDYNNNNNNSNDIIKKKGKKKTDTIE